MIKFIMSKFKSKNEEEKKQKPDYVFLFDEMYPEIPWNYMFFNLSPNPSAKGFFKEIFSDKIFKDCFISLYVSNQSNYVISKRKDGIYSYFLSNKNLNLIDNFYEFLGKNGETFQFLKNALEDFSKRCAIDI